MDTIKTDANEPIIFTANAARKVWELIMEEENHDLKFRAYITGGGCSGYEYGFMFDENTNPDDFVIKKLVDEEDDGESGGEVSLLIDPVSMSLLKGSEIDYQEDINGSHFVIRNPNAKTTCGCGSSFSV